MILFAICRMNGVDVPHAADADACRLILAAAPRTYLRLNPDSFPLPPRQQPLSKQHSKPSHEGTDLRDPLHLIRMANQALDYDQRNKERKIAALGVSVAACLLLKALGTAANKWLSDPILLYSIQWRVIGCHSLRESLQARRWKRRVRYGHLRKLISIGRKDDTEAVNTVRNQLF